MLKEIIQEVKIKYILSKNVEVNQQIKLKDKWITVKEKDYKGIILDDGTFVKYGDTIIAWKK